MATERCFTAPIGEIDHSDPNWNRRKDAIPSTIVIGKMWADSEGYRFTRLTEDQVLVDFDHDSARNPINWTHGKKMFTVLTALFLVLNSGISSSLPSNVVPAMMREFNVTGDMQKVLPTAVFLIGYVVGPLFFSPLSETIGRRPVLLGSFTVFLLGTIACTFAPNWPAMLVFRFICGAMGAAPQTVVGGVYADMFETPRARGRVMAFYMAAASFGPIVGPIISGCSAQYGWRWTFRIDLILVGCSWLSSLFLPETFSRVIVKKRVAILNKQSSTHSYVSQRELQSTAIQCSLKETLTRPITMMFTEPIILFSGIYLAFAYGLIFFCFQAYPIIFEGTYGFDVKQTSLCYLPIGIGAASSGFVSLFYDVIYERAKAQGKRWTTIPELQRLPVACIGGPCLTISLFWLGWTANPQIYWLVPVLSGLFFGFGYQIIFISLLTYVTDAYKIYSASALAASVITRSILGAVFPLAADPMYSALGVGWGTSVLGFASLACIPIPVAFLYAGEWIRKRSTFCQQLLKDESATEDNHATRPVTPEAV
ncbi:putative MFS multidrug transporter [Aspergillus neoniger CBS 115656]|uniref:MFS general substrate transporter n=1 Tax=Aspergillus neoniger (strain CBS 115656) TaxID=1448310 RepID=A0A318YDK7_ASPNB|nr:MFS general substrate transporter [Aspergillus neoniger CBS 115656]PYH31677.1 MFS general substrate transporter [Aspergillus neoniger CBS 115656]